ncbi:hypothetical protein B0J13DRAFT_544443 [Dactylonectria estremocensis]|uniref:Protein transport protein SEC31 n=1 Tax=Dactylonectria estremocensis TaxID=1079267 RepID=A0A9P9F6S7_9HYPO|nr:hypothetical protein B0J13DRAFT_544443 [Dactylonectria estremocensis]
MVRLRDIPRTAAFAWSPDTGKPLLVTGTRAGAVDVDFSDESKLELWDLALDDQQQGLELQPVVSITTDSRFYDVAWSPPDDDHPKGIIAGALENGSLDMWDAEKLLDGDSDALISQTGKHTGAIKALQFNPLKPQILATAGAKGELFIYDVNDVANPFRLGNAQARSDDIECLAWNQKVSHILATGGSGGFVTVWDLKTKKASLTLNNNRKALLTATPDDNTPVIMLWNLRNSNAPEKTLQGHEQDSELLLSSGKDNRTIFPEVTNWTFLTRFNPHNPNLSATASFDDTSKAAAEKNLDDEDFFRAAQDQPQDASWSLSKAPNWFERPIGASFGFGGKLVVFKASPSQPGQKRSSKILISNFSVDTEVSTATENFQSAMASGDVSAICSERVEQSKTEEEKADWKVMETLVGDNPRGKIVDFLGFSEEDLANGADETSDEEDDDEDEDEDDDDDDDSEAAPAAKVDAAASQDDATKKKRLSNFFSGAGGEEEGDDFLSELSAAKGAKTDNPFHLFSDSDTSIEKKVTKALMLGKFEKATDICLKENRMADAFLIANCGGQELVDKVQAAYLARKSGIPSYMRLLGSVINKNLWDVVYNADLENWKETMAIICTFSDPTEFPDLCEALGDRINEEGLRKDASFCYLVGSKLEKVVSIWVAELEEAEQAGVQEPSGDSTFSVHAKSLQNFIEKVTVFRHVTKFEDSEKGLTSDWKLATLYNKYTEYADILSAHGQLEVAQKYLDLLPSTYPAAELARNRVRLATKKPAAQAPVSARTPAAAVRTSSRIPPTVGYQPTQPAPIAATSNPYSALGPNPAAQRVTTASPAQQYMPPANPYQPQGGYSPQVGYQPPSQPGFIPTGPPPMAGPPRNTTPMAPPPPKAKSTENWNDVPLVTKVPSRKATPSVAPITAPFPGQQQGSSHPPPPGSSHYGQRTPATPPPPPPKGSAPPRVQSPLAGPPQTFQGPPQVFQPVPPPAAAPNPYAPPPTVGAGPQVPGVVPRTASPYNAPPASAPPSNRYAPAPSAQPHQPAALPTGPPPTGPPPMNRTGPPAAPLRPTPPPQQAAAPPKAKHPAGDRSHIPANAQGLVDVLSQDMHRVASKAPATFAPQVKDTQKRLNLLFDHLNNEELVQPGTIEQLTQLALALQSKNYDVAHKLQVEIQRDKTEECGNWMVRSVSSLMMSVC